MKLFSIGDVSGSQVSVRSAASSVKSKIGYSQNTLCEPFISFINKLVDK